MMAFPKRSLLAAALSVSLVTVSQPAVAGPPFATDDPEPTEPGHWEIYAPLIDVEGQSGVFAGSTGVEINYGAAPDLQLTVAAPMAYAHENGRWRWGAGDIEMSAKYRFYHDERAGVSVAVFPGVTLPTASNGMGAGRVTALLPVWAQKDWGPWSAFGGGGYAINPGPGNRDYWTGGVAVTRQMGPRLLLGAEVDRSGPDTIDGRASTSLGIGAIYRCGGPFRILASGGPRFSDGGGAAGYQGFVAVGLDF